MLGGHRDAYFLGVYFGFNSNDTLNGVVGRIRSCSRNPSTYDRSTGIYGLSLLVSNRALHSKVALIFSIL